MSEWGTWDAAVEWMRPHLRDTFAAALPCHATRPGRWKHWSMTVTIDMHGRTNTFQNWTCRVCGIAVDRDPAALVGQLLEAAGPAVRGLR